MRRLSAVLLALAGPVWAEPTAGELLQRLDQAMVERAVAAKCAATDSVKAAAFGAHYQSAVTDGQAALKTLASDLDQSHIEKIIAQRYDEIDRRVTAIVRQESCEGSNIREALQKYDGAADAVMKEQSAKKID